ncbi:uncharacterized protein LOC116287120 isoform X3 [Actinia tenebrosa]|uniref:Uncharacterized protein LOC116287120 isoform X3 n=1 Tax=Actinia tenebrosa TaxID=6105 RepID=A0A6P8H1U3_ACTTE|nr:uncharacterized protein LOC116287120 isoform X3 [Actinia tenebrosa]
MQLTKSCILLVLLILLEWSDTTAAEDSNAVDFREDEDGTVYIKSGVGRDIVIQPGYGGRVIINGHLQVCETNDCRAKLGSRKNPARSCKAILEDDPFAESGVYYIITKPYVTKVYCYMDYIPGCGGGGWTTLMKTDGHNSTFKYTSALWGNKEPYNMPGGQSGVDHKETKLPTYWTMPFNSLCLGMKTSGNTSEPNWIRLKYRANSLYSVIADGRYRSTSLGRMAWKSLIPDSSLQLNCNKEGFNSYYVTQSVRIGIISNEQKDCGSPDSRIGFGGAGTNCGTDGTVSTGNAADCKADNGKKSIKTHGYILAQ